MELIGISGYIFAVFAYVVFILLLLAARNKTLSGRLVLTSSIFIIASSVASALQVKQGFSLKYVLAFETFKLAFWSLLIICTQTNVNSIKDLFNRTKTTQYIKIWAILSAVCWGVGVYFPEGVKALFLLLLFLNLWLLVLLEQLYRNADVKVKWALWSLIVALGMATVFDFVLFAQAALINQLDFNYWYARGFVVAVGMPLVLVSTRRIKEWSVNVFVSRDVVFYSSMLLISGMYLLLLALAGYVINYFGGAWGDVVSITFFILGGTVLASLLITERLRREVKVFITKHFFANKYDYRVEWLKSNEQLEVDNSDNYYRKAMDIIFKSLNVHQGALVIRSSLGKYNCVFEQDLPLDQQRVHNLVMIDEFCSKHCWIIDTREYATVENSYPDLDLNIDYCRDQGIDIIIPMFKNKNVYGFFLLKLPKDRGLLNWEDRDLLFALSKQLSNYLSLNEANERIAESKQFDAFHRMSAFLVHDLKNVQAQLSLINSNAQRHRNNPEFIDDVFDTIESATIRLEKVLTQLRNKQVAESSLTKVNVNSVVDKVVNQRNVELPKVSMEILDEIEIVIEQETFCSVLNHLVQNAQEATKSDGWVKIKVELLEDVLHIAIIDNGSGMSENFIQNRLFKAFDTTKENAGMGIGVYEAKQFIESIGGSIQVTSFENEGSIFHLNIPFR